MVSGSPLPAIAVRSRVKSSVSATRLRSPVSWSATAMACRRSRRPASTSTAMPSVTTMTIHAANRLTMLSLSSNPAHNAAADAVA